MIDVENVVALVKDAVADEVEAPAKSAAHLVCLADMCLHWAERLRRIAYGPKPRKRKTGAGVTIELVSKTGRVKKRGRA